jgi:RNA polymerase sigma factor (sigma-70 family)
MESFFKLQTIDTLAYRLPFSLDDYVRVGELYVRWCRFQTSEDQEVLEIWLYCYVLRYFLIKALQNPKLSTVELEALVGETFLRLRSNLDSVRHPERFVAWVAKSCKNAFSNYLRRIKRSARIEVDTEEPVEMPIEGLPEHDLPLLVSVLVAAIGRLPDFLQDVARMVLLERLSYEEISQILRKPQPTIRVYVHRALERLRGDLELQEFRAWLET